MDEVLLYTNRTLSASEVRMLYRGSKHGGNVFGSEYTEAGDVWKLGVRGGDAGNTFGDEKNSTEEVEILGEVYPQVALVSPPDDAQDVSINASLTVNVTDPNGYPMNATCYGSSITGFVGASGANFMLGGETYRFLGVDSYYLSDYATNHTYDDDGNEISGSQQYVTEILDEAQSLGINVIRTWAFGSGNTSKPYGGKYNLFEVGEPGNYSEATFRGLDWLVWQAGKRDIRLMLALVNNWDDYGGMKWYVQHSPTTNKGLSGDAFHDQFYNDPNCMAYYKDYASYLLNRTNYYTGRKYKDDPTIFAWSLANEPRAKSDGDRSDGLLLEWVETMSAYIKSIDSKHLLTVGIEGWGTPWEGTAFIADHNVADIDFSSYALYPDA
jgi:mannan endo-1,4-beta-mannosidase